MATGVTAQCASVDETVVKWTRQESTAATAALRELIVVTLGLRSQTENCSSC